MKIIAAHVMHAPARALDYLWEPLGPKLVALTGRECSTAEAKEIVDRLREEVAAAIPEVFRLNAPKVRLTLEMKGRTTALVV